MYMVYYFIRIAREIFGRRKLQKILILALAFVLIFFIYTKLGAFAYSGLEGNDDYTDPNNSIYKAYDSYLDDLAIRINSSDDSDVQDLINDLLVNHYSFHVMYGQTNQDQNNEFRHMRVIIFNSDTTFLDTTQYTQWLQMNCQIVYNETAPIYVYDFDNMSCTRNTTMMTFYMPRMLINRYNNTLVEVLSNKTNSDTSSVVSAINETNSKLNQTNSRLSTMNDTLNDTQNFITDDSTDTTEMSIDTSQTTIDDNTGIDNFFTNFLTNLETTLTNYDESSVSTISIPLPHNMNPIVLRSDILYHAIPVGPLRTLIRLFWTFLFGGYIVSYIYRMIKWLSSGKVFDDGGVSDFIWYLDTNNEIIKGYMM